MRFNHCPVAKIRHPKQLSTPSRRGLQQLPFPKHTRNSCSTSISFFYHINQSLMNTESAMHCYRITIFTALFALQVNCADARSIYRWTDRQGQVHFSDHAPGSEFTADELRQPDAARNSSGGLRATETELLQHIQQRAIQQKQLAQSRRLKASREQAEHLKPCIANREKLQASRGHGNYKQYSRYLRNHCW